MRRRRAGKKDYWTVEGAEYVYRSPFEQAGTWRVRRRSIATGVISTFVLKDAQGVALRNVTLKAARDAVTSIAVAERIEAEELAKRPEERAIKTGTLDTAFDSWLANIENEVRRPTYLDYETQLGIVRRHFHAAGLENVAEVTLAHVEELFRTLGKEWTGRTKVKYLAVLKRVFTWCVAHRLTRANPAAGMKVAKSWSKAVAQSRFRGVALTEDQARALLEACRAPYKIQVACEKGHRNGQEWTQKAAPPAYLFSAVFFALRTGVRLRNVTGLRWKHLPNDMTELKIGGEEMKSGEPFHVPLHPEITAHLRELLRQYKAEHRRAPSPEGLVFGDAAAWLKPRFEGALARAGLTEIDDKHTRFHDLRHTLTSWCERHCTFAAVQRLLGHAPQSMTHRYVHLNMEELREEVEKLPWLLPAPAAGQESEAAES